MIAELSGYSPPRSALSVMFDYGTAAELFPRRPKNSGSKIGYCRFATAAEAIKFAIEGLPSSLLLDERFGAEQILDLYHDIEFPLPRLDKLTRADIGK